MPDTSSASVNVDLLRFDDYEALYVNTELCAKGTSVDIREIAAAVRGREVGDFNIWHVDNDWDEDVLSSFLGYPEDALQLNN